MKAQLEFKIIDDQLFAPYTGSKFLNALNWVRKRMKWSLARQSDG